MGMPLGLQRDVEFLLASDRRSRGSANWEYDIGLTWGLGFRVI